ncbi:MAG: helix-turn-helix domain-containing protein [Solirubrobacteraceae bacterium]
MERAYVMEEERLASSPEQRRLQLLKRLLAAEPVDQEEMGELDYELDNRWHLGAIASGPNVERFLRRLEADFGAKLLLVSAGGCDWWAWFSRPRGLRVSVLERNLATKPPNGVCMAVGEPGTGLVGWRRTHEEARLASAVAMRKPQRLTRCADVLLDVAFMEHQRLTEFLLRTYSWPLASLHKHGAPARATLRAYFDHGRNISCTASTLKVSRKTVEDRLKAVEKALDRSLNTCVAELDLALRLEALGCGAGLDSQDE